MRKTTKTPSNSTHYFISYRIVKDGWFISGGYTKMENVDTLIGILYTLMNFNSYRQLLMKPVFKRIHTRSWHNLILPLSVIFISGIKVGSVLTIIPD
jgi:hypothetical protein